MKNRPTVLQYKQAGFSDAEVSERISRQTDLYASKGFSEGSINDYMGIYTSELPIETVVTPQEFELPNYLNTINTEKTDDDFIKASLSKAIENNEKQTKIINFTNNMMGVTDGESRKQNQETYLLDYGKKNQKLLLVDQSPFEDAYGFAQGAAAYRNVFLGESELGNLQNFVMLLSNLESKNVNKFNKDVSRGGLFQFRVKGGYHSFSSSVDNYNYISKKLNPNYITTQSALSHQQENDPTRPGPNDQVKYMIASIFADNVPESLIQRILQGDKKAYLEYYKTYMYPETTDEKLISDAEKHFLQNIDEAEFIAPRRAVFTYNSIDNAIPGLAWLKSKLGGQGTHSFIENSLVQNSVLTKGLVLANINEMFGKNKKEYYLDSTEWANQNHNMFVDFVEQFLGFGADFYLYKGSAAIGSKITQGFTRMLRKLQGVTEPSKKRILAENLVTGLNSMGFGFMFAPPLNKIATEMITDNKADTFEQFANYLYTHETGKLALQSYGIGALTFGGAVGGTMAKRFIPLAKDIGIISALGTGHSLMTDDFNMDNYTHATAFHFAYTLLNALHRNRINFFSPDISAKYRENVAQGIGSGTVSKEHTDPTNPNHINLSEGKVGPMEIENKILTKKFYEEKVGVKVQDKPKFEPGDLLTTVVTTEGETKPIKINDIIEIDKQHIIVTDDGNVHKIQDYEIIDTNAAPIVITKNDIYFDIENSSTLEARRPIYRAPTGEPYKVENYDMVGPGRKKVPGQYIPEAQPQPNKITYRDENGEEKTVNIPKKDVVATTIDNIVRVIQNQGRFEHVNINRENYLETYFDLSFADKLNDYIKESGQLPNLLDVKNYELAPGHLTPQYGGILYSVDNLYPLTYYFMGGHMYGFHTEILALVRKELKKLTILNDGIKITGTNLRFAVDDKLPYDELLLSKHDSDHGRLVLFADITDVTGVKLTRPIMGIKPVDISSYRSGIIQTMKEALVKKRNRNSIIRDKGIGKLEFFEADNKSIKPDFDYEKVNKMLNQKTGLQMIDLIMMAKTSVGKDIDWYIALPNSRGRMDEDGIGVNKITDIYNQEDGKKKIIYHSTRDLPDQVRTGLHEFMHWTDYKDRLEQLKKDVFNMLTPEDLAMILPPQFTGAGQGFYGIAGSLTEKEIAQHKDEIIKSIERLQEAGKISEQLDVALEGLDVSKLTDKELSSIIQDLVGSQTNLLGRLLVTTNFLKAAVNRDGIALDFSKQHERIKQKAIKLAESQNKSVKQSLQEIFGIDETQAIIDIIDNEGFAGKMPKEIYNKFKEFSPALQNLIIQRLVQGKEVHPRMAEVIDEIKGQIFSETSRAINKDAQIIFVEMLQKSMYDLGLIHNDILFHEAIKIQHFLGRGPSQTLEFSDFKEMYFFTPKQKKALQQELSKLQVRVNLTPEQVKRKEILEQQLSYANFAQSYLGSADEMIADAGMLKLVQPEKMIEIAPNINYMLNKFIDRHPVFAKLYKDITTRMNAGKESRAQGQLDAMAKESQAASEKIPAWYRGAYNKVKSIKGYSDIWREIATAMVSRDFFVRGVEDYRPNVFNSPTSYNVETGKYEYLNETQQVIFHIDNLQYVDTPIKLLEADVGQKINIAQSIAQAHGINIHHLEVMALVSRVATDAKRQDVNVMNPWGVFAEKTINDLPVEMQQQFKDWNSAEEYINFYKNTDGYKEMYEVYEEINATFKKYLDKILIQTGQELYDPRLVDTLLSEIYFAPLRPANKIIKLLEVDESLGLGNFNKIYQGFIDAPFNPIHLAMAYLSTMTTAIYQNEAKRMLYDDQQYDFEYHIARGMNKQAATRARAKGPAELQDYKPMGWVKRNDKFLRSFNYFTKELEGTYKNLSEAEAKTLEEWGNGLRFFEKTDNAKSDYQLMLEWERIKNKFVPDPKFSNKPSNVVYVPKVAEKQPLKILLKKGSFKKKDIDEIEPPQEWLDAPKSERYKKTSTIRKYNSPYYTVEYSLQKTKMVLDKKFIKKMEKQGYKLDAAYRYKKKDKFVNLNYGGKRRKIKSDQPDKIDTKNIQTERFVYMIPKWNDFFTPQAYQTGNNFLWASVRAVQDLNQVMFQAVHTSLSIPFWFVNTIYDVTQLIATQNIKLFNANFSKFWKTNFDGMEPKVLDKNGYPVYKFKPLLQASIVANIIPALKDSYNVQFGKERLDDFTRSLMEDAAFLAPGESGINSMNIRDDIFTQDRERQLKRILTEIEQGDKDAVEMFEEPHLFVYKNVIKPLYEELIKYGAISEGFGYQVQKRVQKELIEKGDLAWDIDQLIHELRNGRINYRSYGYMTPYLQPIVPFLKAGIAAVQPHFRGYQKSKREGTKKGWYHNNYVQATFWLAGVFAMMELLYEYGFLGEWGPEHASGFADYIKDNNYVIPAGFAQSAEYSAIVGTGVRVPMAYTIPMNPVQKIQKFIYKESFRPIVKQFTKLQDGNTNYDFIERRKPFKDFVTMTTQFVPNAGGLAYAASDILQVILLQNNIDNGFGYPMIDRDIQQAAQIRSYFGFSQKEYEDYLENTPLWAQTALNGTALGTFNLGRLSLDEVNREYQARAFKAIYQKYLGSSMFDLQLNVNGPKVTPTSTYETLKKIPIFGKITSRFFKVGDPVGTKVYRRDIGDYKDFQIETRAKGKIALDRVLNGTASTNDIEDASVYVANMRADKGAANQFLVQLPEHLRDTGYKIIESKTKSELEYYLNILRDFSKGQTDDIKFESDTKPKIKKKIEKPPQEVPEEPKGVFDID